MPHLPGVPRRDNRSASAAPVAAAFFKTVLEKTQGKTDADSHDLMVIGAENRAIRRQMFFGYDNERLIRETSASVAILIPHLGRLTIGPNRP